MSTLKKLGKLYAPSLRKSSVDQSTKHFRCDEPWPSPSPESVFFCQQPPQPESGAHGHNPIATISVEQSDGTVCPMFEPTYWVTYWFKSLFAFWSMLFWRFFGYTALSGTIPAAVSSLVKLTFLCVPTCSSMWWVLVQFNERWSWHSLTDAFKNLFLQATRLHWLDGHYSVANVNIKQAGKAVSDRNVRFLRYFVVAESL